MGTREWELGALWSMGAREWELGAGGRWGRGRGSLDLVVDEGEGVCEKEGPVEGDGLGLLLKVRGHSCPFFSCELMGAFALVVRCYARCRVYLFLGGRGVTSPVF